MAGIIDFGAYVPLHRLGPNTEGWSGTAERAVSNFDEDSITMAVAAVSDCLRSAERDTVDAIYLASTTLTAAHVDTKARRAVPFPADVAERLAAALA